MILLLTLNKKIPTGDMTSFHADCTIDKNSEVPGDIVLNVMRLIFQVTIKLISLGFMIEGCDFSEVN